MARVAWTEPALNDLNELANYISLENISAAKALVTRIFSSTERLSLFPESGRVPPELPQLRYRELIVGPCRVFYRYDSDAQVVYILHVMRSERLLRGFIIDNWS